MMIFYINGIGKVSGGAWSISLRGPNILKPNILPNH
jgi:hypothetical protein